MVQADRAVAAAGRVAFRRAADGPRDWWQGRVLV